MKHGKYYLIGNAHIDPVWLWTWQEGLAEVRSTFRAAVERIEERGEFVFTSSSARFYKWVEDTEPELFAKIVKYVKEGRWAIVGGWWLQPDCNLPCGEALARQGLRGQRYFVSRFGITAKTGYNVDSFGHASQLPQILKKSGLSNYVFMRPAFFEKELPELFVWSAPDGSQVKTFRLPHGYETNTLVDLKTKISKYGADAVKGDRMLFFGVGNHGGGPTKEMLDYLDGIRGKNNYIYSSPDKFFADAASVKLPVVEGELQRHAVGCYSAHSGIKKQNRTAERCLISAEKWSAAAKYLGFASAAERKAVLDDAWGKLLFNHFHDALCGCSIKSACEDLLNTYGAVIDTTTQISGFVTQRMAAEIDTCKGLVPEKAKEQLGAPVVVFNSSGAPVKVKVRLRRKFFELFGAKDNFVAVSPDGSKTPVQKIKGEHLFPDSYDGVFAADVPPFGYKLFYIRKEEFGANTMQVYREPDRYPERSLNAVYGDFVMDNGRLTVRIDGKSFALKSVKDKTGRELMGGTARAVVLDDSDNDTWAHDVSQEAHIRNNSLGVWSSCNEFLGRDIGEFEGVSAEITENGPVRCAVRCRYVYGGSTLEQEFVLYEGEDVLHCTAHLGLRERHKTVKLAFKTHENFDSFVCETPFGFDRRAADGKECFGHRWARAGGLNFASDAKYSYSAAQNELRVVAARSALYADHGGFRDGSGECLDMGAQSFCYALWGGDNFADITAKVASLYAPFEIVFEGYHGGVRPDEESFLKVSRGIEVSAVKEAEDGDGCVVRVYDAGGKGASGEVELFGTKVQINLKPFEIKTLKYSGNKVAETDIPELNL